MKIGIVGCGYVFDHYMATLKSHPDLIVAGIHDIDAHRAGIVARHYGFRDYGSLEAMIADPAVELVVNLTSIESHRAVTTAALEAGRHVYSEKPLVTELDEARDLFALAAAKGVVLSGAPCNMFSDTVQTMWKAVRDGAVGTPLLAYAEFDDNPIYLMHPENWRSRTGAPWPYIHEYEQGCTFEHAGYHLVWLCAIFGPAVSVTGFSERLVAQKTSEPLHPADTPDFSVGCIRFRSGAVARLTCSIVAPADHRMRIIGNAGELTSDTYRHYQSPVTLEQFSALTLNARKARSVRVRPGLGRLFGVGGKRLTPVRHARSHATMRDARAGGSNFVRRLIGAAKRREVGAQDKLLGVALMAAAIREGRPTPIPADFILHVTELTLAIQRAGTDGGAHRMETDFAAIDLLPEAASAPDYGVRPKPGFIERQAERLIDRLHRH